MAKSKKRRGHGARSKYVYWTSKEGLALIRDWVRNGYINDELAKLMKIAPSTLYEWQNKFSEIAEALKDEKQVADAKVESETYRMATGYYYPEEQAMKVKEESYDDEGRKVTREKIEIITLNRYKPAEPTVNMFWLKNRRPETWKEKQVVTVDGTELSIHLEKLKGPEF